MYFMLKMLASPLWIKRLDLFGPYKIFHLGNSLKTASPQVLAYYHGHIHYLLNYLDIIFVAFIKNNLLDSIWYQKSLKT